MLRRHHVVVSLLSLGALAVLLAGLQFPASRQVAAAPKEPAPAECRWADGPIVLDGKADEPAWKNAQVIENFGQAWLGDKAGPLRGKTTARLLWDRDYIYFHADMEDQDLFADVTEHDGAIWENDAFELFFRPGPDKPGYFEFEVNAANAVFDAFFPKQDIPDIINHIKKGEFRVETKVQLRGTLNKRDDVDKGWSVEGRIPWADFMRAGGRPEPGEEWRFGLMRCNYDKGKPDELSTIVPIKERRLGAYFHQIEDYPALKFIGPKTVTNQPYGIATRVPVNSSTVVGSPEPPLPYLAKRMYPDYSPTYPILAKAIPGTDQLLIISENRPWGVTVISRLKDDPAVKTADAVKLLDTPGSGTVYDACFHPKFAENHYLYVGWNGEHKTGKIKKKACRITRYTMTAGPMPTIDEKSAVNILEWESDGHNGAAVCFGTDGMMYVTSGDGTSDSDTDEKGQSTDTLLSKTMRIDVDHPTAGKQYSVPKDNPFAGDARFAPETWAYGFRNPWRITCDEKTGHIWVGNNGQDLWEQAYFVRKGENYGWSVTEGGHPFYPLRKAGPTPISKPAIEHSHAEFRSLTGGIVLYGKQLPELDGAYLYGDYSTGRIWAMKHDGTKPVWHKELASPRIQITSFGQNTKGELIICDHSPTGGLFTLEPMPKADPNLNTFPKKLSDSGLFESVKDHRMKPGVIPYSVNAPFWSDGMHKERFLALPGNEMIEHKAKGSWSFPDKTVIVKSFALEKEEGNPATRRWIETRFFTRQQGEWFGYSYKWNEAGTDAELVASGGADEKFTVKTPGGMREQSWHYPSRAECMACHSRAANFVLGLSSIQMNKTHDYGTCTDNQLRVLEHLRLFKGIDGMDKTKEQLAARATEKKLSDKEKEEYLKVNGQQPGQREPSATTTLTSDISALPRLANPYDPKEDLASRAKSWLHTNCSSCHVEAGGGNAQMELGFETALDKMRILDVKPIHTPFDIADAKLIAPGSPERSVMVKRVGTRGPNQMPPLASNRVDEAGLALIREWIQSMKK
ncbi:PQQ-dependent sugar dehydrogenase [Zavarzinella formosa]|uniref:PQQ-dependent sugar dehydrogenase n=1 Tax=Zavarzinella formosa TaxID=360055 RepID=UPI0002DB4C3B|nr:PQQ-dependent sugar dehydrogenase [Zavarzinella formosa]